MSGPHASAPDSVSILHVPGPQCDGHGDGSAVAGVVAQAEAFRAAGAPEVDLVVVSGNLTKTATPSSMEEALRFLLELREELALPPHRLIVVPGRGDVSLSKCRAHFALCEDEELPPREPYFPKLERYAQIFADLYAGVDGIRFQEDEPWSTFDVDELNLTVAGLNSTWSMTHRPEDDGGSLGQRQLATFARQLGVAAARGRLRIGVMHHAPVTATTRLRLHRGMLHDTADFDNRLAPRLHLLLHGPGEGGRDAAQPLSDLDSGLLCAPVSPAGTAELLRVSTAEVAVWTRPGPPTVRRGHDWQWSGPAGDAPSEPEPVPPEPVRLTTGPGRPVDPQQLLLERVAEVCQVRFTGARINRIEAEPPFLRITENHGGIVSQTQVGVVPGHPGRADLTDFLAATYSGVTGFESFLIFDSEIPLDPDLHDEARRRGVRLQSFMEFQGLRGLFDLSRYVRKQNDRLAASQEYPPDLYVPQQFRDLDRHQPRRSDTVLDELLNLADDPHGRFVLILGEFGTGKTFALRQLAQQIPQKFPQLVPLYIELGRQDRPNSVPGLVASHLANHGEEQIDLRAFNYLLEQGRVVLLFDGFDELAARLTYDTAAEHLTQLLQAANGKAKIFVTSRTQHFRSHSQVRTALGMRIESLPQHRVLSLRRFNHEQIRSYLVNHFAGDTAAADERLNLLGRIANLEELAMNPRMLSFIAALDADQLRRVAESRVTLSPADLYRAILESWLRFEAEVRPGAAGLTHVELLHAVGKFATTLWTERVAALPLSRLSEVAETLNSVTARALSTDQRVHAVGSGSLLVQVNDEQPDSEEELFTFIHSSVMEWLVAAEIADRLRHRGSHPALLSERELTDLVRNFLCDLAETADLRAWLEHVRDNVDRDDETAHHNARRIAAALQTPYSRNMRGANLRGEDLTERQWPGVDLSGADLTDTILSKVDLSGANLSGADLTGARIEHAKLNRTDLTDACFDRARLLDVDLSGAQWHDSRWARAAAVEISADDELLEHIVATGGVTADRHTVEPQLYPASVGVRTGFHHRIGRLPASVAYNPDGTIVAIGSDDGGILLCDTKTGQPLRTLAGHRARVYAVTFDPGGQRLATGSADGTVRIWNVATGDTLGTLGGHHSWVWPMVFAPASGRLVTSDGNGRLRMWDTVLGATLWQYQCDGEVANSASFDPSGEILAVGYRSGVLRMFAAATGELLRQRQLSAKPIYRVAYAPDGSHLACAGGGGLLQLWDARAEQLITELAGPQGRVYTVAFHPTRPLLACGDTSDMVHVFDVASGAPAYEAMPHGAHLYWVTFSPDGELLATGDRAGTVQLWNAATGEPVQTLDAHTGSVWPFTFRPDSAQLAISDDQNITRLWNSRNGRCEHTISGHGRQVTSVSFDRSGRLLSTRCSDGLVRLWDTRLGEPVDVTGSAGPSLSSFGDAVLSPADPVLATVNNEHRISLRNLTTGNYERHFGFDRELWAIAFRPDGTVLATANDDDTVQLWRRSTGQRMHVLHDHQGRVRSIAYSPDGTLLATGCDDRQVRIWNADSGELVARMPGHTDRVHSVAFSPDGRTVVSASLDGTARVWNSQGESLRSFTEHSGRLWSAAFHPDGLIATAGDDLVIRVWHPGTGRVVHTFEGHQRSVWSLAFSPDGTRLASGSDDGTTRLWTLDESAGLEMILTGLPEGWATVTPDGQYKVAGRVNGHLWYVIGACRFEIGQLDEFLPQVRELPPGAEFHVER
jgi:WD40 repeat protein/Cdc6-like AAA superfamily ATPase